MIGKELFNIGFALSTLIIVILFYENNLLAFLLLAIISLIGLIKWRSKITLIMFMIGSFFGGLSEILAVYFGVWTYTNPNFINVPFWLFIVWGNTFAFLYQTSITIKKRFNLKK